MIESGYRGEASGHDPADSITPTDLRMLRLPTLEGNMIASPQDWIIRGVSGEFYPCKPDIFMATYEPAGGEAS